MATMSKKEIHLIEDLREKLGFSSEKKIHVENFKIGGKSFGRMKDDMKGNKVNLRGYSEELLDSLSYYERRSSREAKEIAVVMLTGNHLGLKERHSMSDLFKRIEDLGLFMLPAEAGPNILLQLIEEKRELRWGFSHCYIAMHPCHIRGGYQLPDIFTVYCSCDKYSCNAEISTHTVDNKENELSADTAWVIALQEYDG